MDCTFLLFCVAAWCRFARLCCALCGVILCLMPCVRKCNAMCCVILGCVVALFNVSYGCSVACGVILFLATLSQINKEEIGVIRGMGNADVLECEPHGISIDRE